MAGRNKPWVWGDEKLGKLKVFWAEGRRSGFIAQELGVTSKSVRSAVRRYHLGQRAHIGVFRVWDDNRRIEFRKLWSAGTTREDLATHFNTSIAAISATARRIGAKGRPRKNTWPVEDDDYVRYGRANNRSASEIARGLGRTKNAVIGRMGRLGLSIRSPEELRAARRKGQRIGVANRPKLPPRPPRLRWVPYARNNLPTPPSLKIPFIDTLPGQCLYMGTGNNHDCCGHPTFDHHRWCEAHYALTHRRGRG